MRKLAMLFAFVATIVFAVGCEGPSGPQGPPGPSEYPFVLEKRLSFDGDLNKFVQAQAFKHPIKVYKGDVVLAFVMKDNTQNGNPIWTPMPHRFFVDVNGAEKELEYTYNFSDIDVEVVASANAALGNFNGDGGSHLGFLKNMIFRFVYLPAADPVMKSATASDSQLRTMSYDDVVKAYNLEGVKVIKDI